MVGGVHIPVCSALQVINDFFISVYGGVFPLEIQLRVHGKLIRRRTLMLIDCLPDEVYPLLFILTHVQQILISFHSLTSPHMGIYRS